VRQDKVNLKKLPHRVSNARPSGLKHSALTTTLPRNLCLNCTSLFATGKEIGQVREAFLLNSEILRRASPTEAGLLSHYKIGKHS
jgi:hypothetical protein